MSERVCFTDAEQSRLRQAMKSGGIFLKLYSNPDSKVEVQASDGNGSWKTIKVLDRIISDKIYALYNAQTDYKAPLEAGFKQVSLSWFIAEYC